MANWTDGPEYAPTERPSVFVAPDADPLDAPPVASTNGESPAEPEVAPVAAPAFEPAGGVALEALEATPAVERDPRQPFDVATTPLTTWAAPPEAAPPPALVPPGPAGISGPPGPPAVVPGPPSAAPASAPGSAWGWAHAPTMPHATPSWTPAQPVPAPQAPPPQHVAGPTPAWSHQPWPTADHPQTPPTWTPAPWEPPGPPELRPVGVGEMVRASTPGVLICLAVGGLVPALSLPLLVVAQALAGRIEYRRTIVARAFGIAVVGVLGLGLFSVLLGPGYFDVFEWYDASLGWAVLANWGLLVATPLIVGDALRRGERPDPR